MSSVFSSVMRVYKAAIFTLHVLWINVHNSIWAQPCYRHEADHEEMAFLVAVVGDDAVTGLGDWVVMGGAAGFPRYMEEALRRYPNVRRSWTVGKYGVPRSSSADWCPSSTTAHQSSRNLFEHCFGKDGVLRMAPIVCVNVGWNDTGEAETTLRNITELSTTLRAQGKVVLVASIATPRRPLPVLIDRATKRNALLRESVSKGPQSCPFLQGPELDGGPLTRAVKNYRFEGHYSGTGHRKVGELWAEAVSSELTKLEWKWFQVLMTTGKFAKKTSLA